MTDSGKIGFVLRVWLPLTPNKFLYLGCESCQKNLIVQVETGTLKNKRTTIPLMYNLGDKVEGLDVIDFPGGDDGDENIQGLVKFLLSLAQLVVFVVDYRYVYRRNLKYKDKVLVPTTI